MLTHLNSDVLYHSAAGAMLSQMVHSLLLLPEHFIRPLLHELLSLLPHLDRFNRMLPAAASAEQQEIGSPEHGTLQKYWFVLV